MTPTRPLPDRVAAVRLLEEHLARGFSGRPPPRGVAALERLCGDEAGAAYERLDAALSLALLGNRAAVPTLLLVFDRPGFALTNSLHEQAYAALALALLGEQAVVERLRGVPPINLNRTAVPLALSLLGAAPPKP